MLFRSFQVKYRARPELEYGIQAFGNMGDWTHWEPSSKQEHVAGPALFGKIKTGAREAIKWNVAWLVGLSRAAADNTLRVQAEYEF